MREDAPEEKISFDFAVAELKKAVLRRDLAVAWLENCKEDAVSAATALGRAETTTQEAESAFQTALVAFVEVIEQHQTQ